MSKRQAHLLQRRRLLLAAVALGAAARRAAAQAPAQQDPWPSLAAQIFNGRTVQDGATIMAIDAPYRAEDAALVPVAVRSLLPSWRLAPHRRYHACDRREPLAAGGSILSWTIKRAEVAVHPRPRRTPTPTFTPSQN